MKEDNSSATAQRVAMHRAAHQLFDDPKVFEDALALVIIGAESAAALKSNPQHFKTNPLVRFLRAFLAVRSRFAEERLGEAVRRGVRQYVVLGAGLDTFAYRGLQADDVLQVFEVDHPATQAWKRSRLEEAGICIPRSLHFAPVDLERRPLADGLQEAGFEVGVPAFFSWLGVTPYLSLQSIRATLAFIAASTGESGAVVFDYAVTRESLELPRERLAFDALAQWVSRAGEPFRTFFDPPSLVEELHAIGFSQVEDMGPEAINERYFGGRKDGLKVGSLAHLMHAKGGHGLARCGGDEGPERRP